MHDLSKPLFKQDRTLDIEEVGRRLQYWADNPFERGALPAIRLLAALLIREATPWRQV